MAIEMSEHAGQWQLTLSGVVGVAQARELADHARAVAIQGGGDLVVSLEDVRAVDTAAAQIVLALRRALVGQGRALRLVGVPPAVAERRERAGLFPALGLS